MLNLKAEIVTLESMILEGEEQLAKFERNLKHFDWEPKRSVHLLGLIRGRLNSLFRERDALLASEAQSVH